MAISPHPCPHQGAEGVRVATPIIFNTHPLHMGACFLVLTVVVVVVVWMWMAFLGGSLEMCTVRYMEVGRVGVVVGGLQPLMRRGRRGRACMRRLRGVIAIRGKRVGAAAGLAVTAMMIVTSVMGRQHHPQRQGRGQGRRLQQQQRQGHHPQRRRHPHQQEPEEGPQQQPHHNHQQQQQPPR